MLKHYALQKGVERAPMAQEVREEFGYQSLIVGKDLMTVDI